MRVILAWDVQLAVIAAKRTSKRWVENWEFALTTSWGIPKFVRTFSWKFPCHLTFIPEFTEFSVEWFAFRRFNNFRIFWSFSQEVCVLFVPVSKISKFLVEWQAPMFPQIQKNFVLHSLRSALTQRSPRELHFISRQTCLSDGNPLCWKIYS